MVSDCLRAIADLTEGDLSSRIVCSCCDYCISFFYFKLEFFIGKCSVLQLFGSGKGDLRSGLVSVRELHFVTLATYDIGFHLSSLLVKAYIHHYCLDFATVFDVLICSGFLTDLISMVSDCLRAIADLTEGDLSSRIVCSCCDYCISFSYFKFKLILCKIPVLQFLGSGKGRSSFRTQLYLLL